MKRLLLTICSASLLFACNNETKNTDGTETKKDTSVAVTMPTQKTPPDSATAAKNWEEYMTPSKVHAMMASWNGSWTGEVSSWYEPGKPPQVSKGTAVNKMIMGGRYQVSNHTGTMMGMPFEGMSLVGYDNAKKEFISNWIDNVGTGIMTLRGPWDEASKSMTLKGKCVDPSAGDGSEMEIKEIFKIIDDNNQVMEMYGVGPDGKETKMMEIKFTRKK